MSSAEQFSQRSRRAGGQPISYLMHKALAHPDLISLAAGFVDQETLPAEATRVAMEALLSDGARARAALQYGTTPGYAPLREEILDRLRTADGDPNTERKLSIENVVLTAGSNQLLHLVGDTLLDPGDIVLCGAPSYFVFLGMLGNLGVRTVGVTVDQDGMIPEALEVELARRQAKSELARVKAIYVNSDYENPSTASLSMPRRNQIVEIARQWSKVRKIYVIEDAAYRELRYFGDDLPSMRAVDLDGDTVILAGTFSKSYSPGIRVGWGILPSELIEPLSQLKGNIDFGSPNLSQHLMATVLELGLFDTHVRKLRESYRDKLAAMLEALDQNFKEIPGISWQPPTGGLYVWLKLPDNIDTGPEGPLFDRALDEGVLYVPGQYCYPAEGAPVRLNMIRLSFGVQSAVNIRRGVEALARAVRDCLEQASGDPKVLSR